jgi:hypothetical protein
MKLKIPLGLHRVLIGGVPSDWTPVGFSFTIRVAIPLAMLLFPVNLLRGTEPRWPEQRREGLFLYRANFSLSDNQPLLEEVAQLQTTIPETLQLPSPREPVHVYLFDDHRTYQKYVHYYFPQVPSRRALFIKDRGPGMVFAFHSREMDVDLRHECTHAILHSVLPMVPLWLDEGLAEYFEVPPPDRYDQNPHLAGTRIRLRWRRPPKLRDLEELRDVSEMKADHYRDAWAWVHFLLHGPAPVQAELQRFLADIQSHTPPGRLGYRLARRVPDFEQEFLRHFRELR